MKRKTLDPVWEEEAFLPCPANEPIELTVTINDADRRGDTYLGSATLSFTPSEVEEMTSYSLSLQNNNTEQEATTKLKRLTRIHKRKNNLGTIDIVCIHAVTLSRSSFIPVLFAVRMRSRVLWVDRGCFW